MATVDNYGNRIVLGLTESQWPYVLGFGALGLLSANGWFIAGNFVAWYLYAFIGRRILQ